MSILAEYSGWRERRIDLNEREDEGQYVNPNEWQASDNEGVYLLGEVAAALEEALALLERWRGNEGWGAHNEPPVEDLVPNALREATASLLRGVG